MRKLPASTVAWLATALLASLSLIGCGKAPPPPDPAANAAASEATSDATSHREPEDAVRADDYRGRAAAAGDDALEADKKRAQELKDAGG
jgi:hypothetical protein